MIQRPQTLYLLVAVLLSALALAFPLALLPSDADRLTYAAALEASDPQPLLWLVYIGILSIAGIVLPLIAIFRYKRRPQQIRLCWAAILLLVAAIVVLAVCAFLVPRDFLALLADNRAFDFIAVTPVVSLILMFLAKNAVRRDERLVRAADRIR